MKLNDTQILEIRTMQEQGYIVSQKHPNAELYIYNYTAKAQYESFWNEITLMCRGLILSPDMEIVARPLQKFFNYDEVKHKYNNFTTQFEVFEKLDGSLGILYWLNDKPFIASRGSFNSEQALKATNILYEKYASLFDNLNKKHTYLFEIIYPENRIVVDYGQQEDIILIAIVDIETGKEKPIVNTGFNNVQTFRNIEDFTSLFQKEIDNKEGYVVRFKNDYRIKIKFEEYIRVHRLVTNVSTITIWEHLSAEQPIDKLIEQVPDEFYNWVKQTVADLTHKYLHIETQCKADFKPLASRKETALYFQKCGYPSVLFAMYTQKNYSQIIWKAIKPKFSKPFKTNTNDNQNIFK